MNIQHQGFVTVLESQTPSPGVKGQNSGGEMGIKTGIASKGEAVVPNPVRLRPFRTFVEVEQPESAFVFRMRQDSDDGVECAVFEADGGAWKNAAMENIKKYLQLELSDLPQFTVIS